MSDARWVTYCLAIYAAFDLALGAIGAGVVWALWRFLR